MPLTDKIKDILFEETWQEYGSEYMSHPYEQENHVTVQPELPISPSPLADMQLTDSAPPVDDDSYTPLNNKELANALAALALKVPDDFVEGLYKQIRYAVLDAEQNALTPDLIPAEESAEAEEAVAADEDLAESFDNFLQNVMAENAKSEEEEWEEFRHGEVRSTDDPEDEDVQAPDVSPDTVPGKYLAQYWRERPGKDPAKFKGSGESTMVTATGRLLQNVVRPLIDVPKAQLQDAAEYLRLQFRMLSQDRDDIPAEAPRTFSGMYLKKLVPKLSEDQLGGNFLTTVVSDFKRRDKKWLNNLVDSAFAEVASEKAAREKLRSTLEKESPEHAELVDLV